MSERSFGRISMPTAPGYKSDSRASSIVGAYEDMPDDPTFHSTPLQSMMKNTTETGDIGTYSYHSHLKTRRQSTSTRIPLPVVRTPQRRQQLHAKSKSVAQGHTIARQYKSLSPRSPYANYSTSRQYSSSPQQYSPVQWYSQYRQRLQEQHSPSYEVEMREQLASTNINRNSSTRSQQSVRETTASSVVDMYQDSPSSAISDPPLHDMNDPFRSYSIHQTTETLSFNLSNREISSPVKARPQVANRGVSPSPNPVQGARGNSDGRLLRPRTRQHILGQHPTKLKRFGYLPPPLPSPRDLSNPDTRAIAVIDSSDSPLVRVPSPLPMGSSLHESRSNLINCSGNKSVAKIETLPVNFETPYDRYFNPGLSAIQGPLSTFAQSHADSSHALFIEYSEPYANVKPQYAGTEDARGDHYPGNLNRPIASKLAQTNSFRATSSVHSATGSESQVISAVSGIIHERSTILERNEMATSDDGNEQPDYDRSPMQDLCMNSHPLHPLNQRQHSVSTTVARQSRFKEELYDDKEEREERKIPKSQTMPAMHIRQPMPRDIIPSHYEKHCPSQADNFDENRLDLAGRVLNSEVNESLKALSADQITSSVISKTTSAYQPVTQKLHEASERGFQHSPPTHARADSITIPFAKCQGFRPSHRKATSNDYQNLDFEKAKPEFTKIYEKSSNFGTHITASNASYNNNAVLLSSETASKCILRSRSASEGSKEAESNNLEPALSIKNKVRIPGIRVTCATGSKNTSFSTGHTFSDEAPQIDMIRAALPLETSWISKFSTDSSNDDSMSNECASKVIINRGSRHWPRPKSILADDSKAERGQRSGVRRLLPDRRSDRDNTRYKSSGTQGNSAFRLASYKLGQKIREWFRFLRLKTNNQRKDSLNCGSTPFCNEDSKDNHRP